MAKAGALAARVLKTAIPVQVVCPAERGSVLISYSPPSFATDVPPSPVSRGNANGSDVQKSYSPLQMMTPTLKTTMLNQLDMKK